MKKILIAFYVTALLSQAFAAWTEPVLLLNNTEDLNVQSIYRDPVSSLIHFTTMERYSRKNQYFAVTPNGTLVHKALFNQSTKLCSVIRGTGNHLLLALPAYSPKNRKNTVHFAESFDGGENWKIFTNVLPDDQGERMMQDMLYIAETGRIFIFYTAKPGAQLRVISRAPGSIIFSADALVANNVGDYSRHLAKAAYSFWLNKPIIHVAYTGYEAGWKMMYTRSHNNGVSWLPSKNLNSWMRVYAIANMVALGESVYVAFTCASSYRDHSMFAFSHDHGETFNTSLEITKAKSYDTDVNHGLSAHDNILASLFVTNVNTLEFTLWNATSMEPSYRDFPSFLGRPTSAALDLELGERASPMNATAVFTVRYNRYYQLYFARGSGINFNSDKALQ